MVTGEFDVEILRDLIAKGYEGQELLEKFKQARAEVPGALKRMFDDMLEKYNGRLYTVEEIDLDFDDDTLDD